jgi:Apea-like HEPN
MSITPQEKLDLDLRGLRRINDGLVAYNVSPQEAMGRLKAHKEDGFCWAKNYKGDGKMMCTNDAHLAMVDLAERRRESMPVPDDYSVLELYEGIREHVVRAIVDEKEEEPALSRVLAEAVADAEKCHIERAYHFPCVVVPYQKPPQFNIGIVTFTSAEGFPLAFEKELKDLIGSSKDPQYMSKRVDGFKEHIQKYGWIASVKIPPCSEESAKARAEAAVTTALNLLRLLFGVHYGRDMRVAHVAYTQSSSIEYAITENERLELYWSRKGNGALVEENWHLMIATEQDFWRRAALLVKATVAGERSEIANRVIDALTWFGETAFESAGGTQIVNFVAALERLTTTEWFSPHRFCARVALLAYNDDADFDKTYWDAYEVHTARSEVIHGSHSPSSRVAGKNVRLAHDIARNALFRGLEVHSVLDSNGRTSTLEDLQSFFDSQYSKWASVLKVLEPACKARTKAKQQSLTRTRAI